MKSTKTFGIHHIIRKNKANKDDMVPIYTRITIDGTRIEMSLKKRIWSSDWNETKGAARGSRPEIKHLNQLLDEVKCSLTDCYHEMQRQNLFITVEGLKNFYLKIDQQEHTLCALIDYHNTQYKSTLAQGTLKNYFTTQKYVKSFLKAKLRKTDVHLTELSYKFIFDFEQFLRNHKPLDHHKPIGNNGVMKHIERLRKMINVAIRLEWIERDPFSKYQQKFIKFERGFLDKTELSKLENHTFDIPRLEWVRDLFVFSCYTGLAYIDLINLKHENLIISEKGDHWITTTRQKTRASVRIPLLPKPMAMIRKYANHPRGMHTGNLFPIISNQNMNGYLKEIAAICKIEKNMTFHLARHTFATTVTLTNGVPIETVSKMLGHASITTTQIYAKVVENKIYNDMKELSDKL